MIAPHARDIAGRAILAALAAGCLFVCAGCPRSIEGRMDVLQQQLDETREKNLTLQRDNEKLRNEIETTRKQVRTLQALGPKRLDLLFHVVRIELRNATGAYDDGEKSPPGDDGVKVFFRPIDQQGSPLKAAGSVNIRLFDLAGDESKLLLAEYNFPVEKIGDHWSNFFGTYHYSFTCPWTDRRPRHEKVTVRVAFTDYLTGQTFDEQKVVDVKLPPQDKADGQNSPTAPTTAPNG